MPTSAVPMAEPTIDWAAAGKAFGVGVTTVDQENSAASAPIDWAAEGKKFGAGVSTVDNEKHVPVQPPPVIDWAAEGKKFGAGVSTVDQENAPGVQPPPLPMPLRGGTHPMSPAEATSYAPPGSPQLVLPEDSTKPMMTHAVAAPGAPPTKTQYPAPPPTQRQQPTFREAREQAAQSVADAVDKNFDFLVGPFFGVEKGVIKAGAQMAADPLTGAVMAGTAGLGAIPGVVGESIGTGLSAYFATEAGKAFLNRFPTVKQAIAAGDYQKAAEEGGGALADAVMAYGAALHAAHGAEVLPAEVAKASQQLRSRFGPAKPVQGEVLGRPDPYAGIPQINPAAPPTTFEGGPPSPPPPAEPPPGFDFDQPPAQPPAQPSAPPEPEINYADPSTLGGPFSAPPPAPVATAPNEPAEPTINQNEFIKAHNLWNNARNRVATDYMKNFPGASFDQALGATAGTYGEEPKPEHFRAPPEPAPEPEPVAPPEPPKPDHVQRVGPDTPNPPTAAIPTQPESPETIALQMGQLRDGTRRVVMFPQGGGQPFEAEHFGDAPIGITHDPFGNTYAYRKDLIAEGDIHRAAKDNTLPEILGGRGGLGVPDKTAIQGEPIAVVARGPDGTEAQTTVTDAAHLPETHAATQAVMPAGGTVNIEPADHVVGKRAGISDPWRPVPPAPAPRPVTPQVSPLGGVTPFGMPGPVASPITAATTATPKLPHALAGAKPRYNYQNKAFDLDFKSDVDKAAVIAAQKNRSKHDQKYVDFVKDATGLTEAGVRAHGAKVKDLIKGMARDAQPGTLRVPTHSLTGLMTKSRAQNRVAAEEKRNGVPSSADNRATAPQSAGPHPGGAPSGTLSNGNGPVRIREDSGLGGESHDNGIEPNTGDFSKGVRRITGSADPPVLPAGRKQADSMVKQKAKKKFDLVVTGTSTRAIETGGYFGKPVASSPFDGWPRAEYEGQPAAAVSDEMKYLMLNPDAVPPGVSPLSGKPGISWNQMAKPMFKAVQDIAGSIGPKQRVLIVTSGGNLQAIDAWGKAGYPADYEFSHAAMAADPHWSVTGKMFTLGPGGLGEVQNNNVPGRLYITEHVETAFNPKVPQKAAVKAKGKVALERRREFYRKGNIVQGYGGAIDRVLDYAERPDGTWDVRVQGLRPDGTVDPNERLRLHSTEPGKDYKVLYRAAVESGRGAETSTNGRSEVLGPRRPSYQSWDGNPTIIRIPGEDRTFEARYQLRELEDVVPSHNPFTLDKNPDYQHRNDRNYKDPINAERILKQTNEFDPAYVATESPDANNGGPVIDQNGNVLGGNSRAMTLARVYAMNPGGAEAYKGALEAKASAFGLDPARVRGMRNPVLVRQITRQLSPEETKAAITDFNKVGTAALTPDEQAIRDSNRVSPETVDYIGDLLNAAGENGTLAQALDGPRGALVIEKLMDDGVVSISEKGKLVKDGLLTSAGKDRIAKLLLGRLFADPAHLDATPAELRNKLERIVAPVVRVGDPAWNLMPEVRAAVQMLDDANSRGIKNLGDLVAQTGLFGDSTAYPAKVVDLANFIKANGPLKLAKAFSQYATDSTGSLFHSLSPDEAFAQAFISDVPALPDSGVYMGMGLGAMQPYLDAAGKAAAQYAREEVLPTVERLLGGGRQAVGAMVHMFSPRTGVPEPILDSIYRMRGGREAAAFLLSSKLDKWSDAFRQMNQQQMVEFIDRQKSGQQQSTPDLQNLSDFLRRVDDALYQQVARYKPSLPYLENHYRVLWKVLPGSQTGRPRGFSGVFRRPLQGTKGFLKQHTLADMSEGLRQGGVPYSYNPVVMFQAHYADTMKYVTAQHLWEQWGADGTRRFVKTGKEPPAGYTKLDDAIARTYFPQPAGLVHTGDWYVNEGAARLLNNYLGRDYLRQVYSDAPASKISGNLGSAMLAVKNATTAVELSLSPFHAVFETFEAMGSQIGYGMRKVWNLGVARGDWRKMAEGLKDIGEATVAPYTVSRLGGQAKRAYGDFEKFKSSPAGQQWLKDNPTLRDATQYYFLGGGTMGVPHDFQNNAEKSFISYLRSARTGNNPGHYISAGIRSIPALMNFIMKPLFEIYIPNLKLGFFLKEFGLARQEMSDRLLAGEMTLNQLARQTVDSVENRFGEMNFDNLFWDRTFKTAAQILFRSVTWKLGNIRAEAGAVMGQGREFKRALDKKAIPQLHGSMAWFLGMSALTAAMGAIITKATTGKGPREFKDFVYPLIDDAAHIRISLPTYWRDILHFAHSPKEYLFSSASGDIGKALDIVENKDFYGNSVYNEDDSTVKKVLDSILHFAPLPFSLSSYQQAKGQGGSKAAKYAGYAGFTKAPKYIEQSAAQQLASEYAAHHREAGSRNAFQADRAKAETGIRNIMRRGANPQKEVADAEAKGLIVPKDVSQLQKQSQASDLKRMVASLSMTEALRVYDRANTAERTEIQRDVRNKVFASAKHRPAEFGPYGSDARKLTQKYFSFKPPMPSGMEPPQAMGTPVPIQ